MRDIKNFSDIDEALFIQATSSVMKQLCLDKELLKEAQVLASKDDLRKCLHMGTDSIAIKIVSVAVYAVQKVLFVIQK